MGANIDYQDTLFQSIDTIVSARIANLPYDQTIECYITNNSQADKGIYKVKYQNAEFEAVSDNTEYKIDERVYVQVPQGDFDQDKIIIRKKQLEDKQKVKKLPLLSMAKSANFFTTAQNQEIYNLKIDSLETTGNKSFVWNNNVYAGYTQLGIKASILLDITQNVTSGDYGLKIEIVNFDQSNTPNNFSTAEKHTDIYYLKIEDMIGSNFYNTNGYQNQEKVIDITNKVISSIKVSFWQDGNFTSQEGPIINKYISYTNLQLYLGYDVLEFTESPQLFLYSEDGLQYSTNINSKTLRARLLTLDKVNLTFSEENGLFLLDNTLQMNWGKYNAANNELSELYDQVAYETIEVSKNFKLSTELSTIRNKIQEQYICAISANTGRVRYRSNILSFSNVTYLANSNILDIISGLQMTVEDDNGIYQFYGQDNIATNKIATSSPHYILLTYLSSNEESDNNGIKIGDKIIWKIPKYRTMILAPRLNIEYKQRSNEERCVTDDENYWIITQIVQSSDIDSAGAYRIPFYINDYYSPQNTNNTIICQLQRGFDVYETSKELLFGTSGSQGNEYNFRLRLWRYDANEQNGKKYVNAYYITSPSNEPYFIEAEVYDYDNNLVEISEVSYRLLYDNNKLTLPQFFFDTSYNNSFTINSNITIAEQLYDNYNKSNGISTTVFSNNIRNTACACLKHSQSTQANNSNDFLLYYSNVIEGIINIGDREYKSYFPIAVAQTENLVAINGSTVITYDITGKKPFYTKTPFRIKTNYNNTQASLYNWYIYPESSSEDIWAPKLAVINETMNTKELIPPSIYKKDSNQKFALVCAEADSNTPIWIQPIHIIQNKYPGAMENGEGNNTYINSNEYIAHTMVGRVNEDINQTMSGLFVGILGNKQEQTEKLGLYAFKQGHKFFCVDEDGLLYLDGGLNQTSRIANITLGNCKLEDNLFDFTEGASVGQDDVDVILIKDNSQRHNTTVAINSSGSIKANTYSFNDLNNTSLVSIQDVSRQFDSTQDTAYFYGTAALAQDIIPSSSLGLVKDLKKIKSALENLGMTINFSWVPD